MTSGGRKTLALGAGTLEQLSERLPVPTYDRSTVSTGIVHLGMGGFHRAHQAMYVDALLHEGKARDWGITGVGLMPQDEAMAEVMSAQDCLYTLVLKHPDGTHDCRVIGSVVDYVFAPAAADAVLEVMSEPATRIVSMTITEGGYHVSQAQGTFDDSDPAIRKDIEGFADGSVPTAAFGFVVRALARRREAGTDPFTVMSCDNIPGNGGLAREMISAFADRCDQELGTWVREHVRFPSSMVDRITPTTSEDDRAALADELGVLDRWPVVCEPFAQWVVEDDFTSDRPPLEDVGVQVVDDVTPYELMKLRLLNAGHQALCYLGYLSGYRYAHEVAQDELFAGFVRGWMDDEVTPTLEQPDDIDLDEYKDMLLERFANAEVGDSLERLCADTSDRIPTFLVPTVLSNLEDGGPVRRSALVLASWARYAEGVDEDGDPIEVVDRRKEEVMARASRQGDQPLAFLEDDGLFGDLRSHDRFTDAYRDALDALHRDGARATVAAWRDG